MRKPKLDKTMLSLAGQGKFICQIAKETGRSPSAVSQRMKNWNRDGIIHKVKKGSITELSLTPLGAVELSRLVTDTLTSNPETYIRIHCIRNQIFFKEKEDIGLKVCVKDSPDIFKPTILTNHDLDGWLICKNVKYFLDDCSITVVLSIPSIVCINANWKEAIATELANFTSKSYEEAFKLASKYGIELSKPEFRTISADTVTAHVAIVNTTIARRVLQNGWTKEFNREFKEIMVIDNSLSNPELEVITPNHVFEYVDALLQLTAEFKDKDFGIYELIKRLKELIGNL